MFGLVRLVILNRKSIPRSVRLSVAHALYIQGILLCKKLSNKQSGRPIRFIIL